MFARKYTRRPSTNVRLMSSSDTQAIRSSINFISSVQGKPPTLAQDGGAHRYSRAFKEIVDACLAKNPSKR